jgi:hypothetical protein
MGQLKEGQVSIQGALNELIEAGYLSRKKFKDGTGEYTLHWEPYAKSPNVENPNLENLHVLNRQNIPSKGKGKDKEKEEATSEGIPLKNLLKQLYETLTQEGGREANLFYKKYGIKDKSQVQDAVLDLEIRLTNRGRKPKNMYELRREWDYYCSDVLDSKYKNKPWD